MKRATHEIVLEDRGTIPGWVADHASFRRWAYSPAFPETGRYGWLNGKVWVDLSMERDSHNQVKTECAIVLGGLIKSHRLGRYWSDRMLLTNLAAGLSTEPDGMFAMWSSLRENRLRVAGVRGPGRQQHAHHDQLLHRRLPRHRAHRKWRTSESTYLTA